MKFVYISLLILCFGICHSCKQQQPAEVTHKNENYIVWADPITYEVLINNPDSLNHWESTKLKHVKQHELVDHLFEMVYSGQKQAYDYNTHEPISISEIKELELKESFSRNKVGKLQFTETWLFEENSGKLKKDVQSILLAYEVYNDLGELRGYKAAFYLKDF
ncbi:hypothetical protein E9993_01985 [Labilibacter sediminis]|nr:hypothetical protein E9993_01985 [Labilibacter sediminis]